MTEYAPRTSQDYNLFYTNPQLAMSHYSNDGGDNVLYNNNHMPYSTVHGSYPTYSTTFVPSQPASSAPLYMQPSSSMAMHYQLRHTGISLPSQPLPVSHSSYYVTPLPTQRSGSHQPRLLESDSTTMVQTESQESVNDKNMLSEPVMPPLEGYPDVNEFDDLMKRYVADLSPKKQDKALIHALRAANIKAVLIDKKTTTVESAQFRFWVKKMFTLMPQDPKIPDRKKKICHEGKPVAVREKLFKILTNAHKQCQHGGRDKTSAQVRRVYSWVPKELISRFVKLCPTCQVRRGTNRVSPSESEKSPEAYVDARSPDRVSPSSQREALLAQRCSIATNSPLQLTEFSTIFQQQNRWMTPIQPAQDRLNRSFTFDPPARTNTAYSSNENSRGVAQSSTSVVLSNPNNSRTFPPLSNRNGVSNSSSYASSDSQAINGQRNVYSGYITK